MEKFGKHDTYLPCRTWCGRETGSCFRRRRPSRFYGRATNRGLPQGRPSMTPSYGARSMKSSKNGSSKFQVPEPARLWRVASAFGFCPFPVPCSPACPPGLSGGFPVPCSPFPVPRSRFPVPSSRLCPVGHGCPRVSGSPFPVPRSRLLGVIHNGVWPSVHVTNHQLRVKIDQNRSKRRRFPSKRDQKGARFVMPILTFWGLTPSGASARAVLAFRKG
jgi:hypothetical protein